MNQRVRCGWTLIAALAGACAAKPTMPSPEKTPFHWTSEYSRKAVHAFIDGLPPCTLMRDIPSVKTVKADRWPEGTCVAVRGRLFMIVMDPCPQLLWKVEGGAGRQLQVCLGGWMLWEPSQAIPKPFDTNDWIRGVALDPRYKQTSCDDRDAESAGMTGAARLTTLPRPGNGELDAALGLRQPIVAVMGQIPRDTGADAPVALQSLNVTHMCIVEEPDAGAPPASR